MYVNAEKMDVIYLSVYKGSYIYLHAKHKSQHYSPTCSCIAQKGI
jgi:hypothetical protein